MTAPESQFRLLLLQGVTPDGLREVVLDLRTQRF